MLAASVQWLAASGWGGRRRESRWRQSGAKDNPLRTLVSGFTPLVQHSRPAPGRSAWLTGPQPIERRTRPVNSALFPFQ